MYISEATHDTMCQAGMFALLALLGIGLIALAIDFVSRRREIIGLRIKIIAESVLIAVLKALMWAIDLLMRISNAAQRRRDKRRKALAMKVFDKPVRWSVK